MPVTSSSQNMTRSQQCCTDFKILLSIHNKFTLSKAASPSTRFTREKNRLLVSVWQERICWFYVVKQEDLEHLSTVYNEKVEYYLFSSRAAAQLENKMKNLKDQYKKLKDSLHKTGEGFDKDKINDFPFFETFELLLGGKESYNLKKCPRSNL